MRIILGEILTEFYIQDSKRIMPFYRILDLELDKDGEVINFKLDTLISDPNNTTYVLLPYIDIHREDKLKLEVLNKMANGHIAFINFALDLAYNKRSPTKKPFRIK